MECDENCTGRAPLQPTPMAELPAGRRLLLRRWWDELDLGAGTTLLARRLHQDRRARLRLVGRLKHDPDVKAQNAERSHAHWCWEFDQAALDRCFGRSCKVH
jgi:hypothetical protein